MKELLIQIIAVSIGASLAFLYWLIQHYFENKEKKEDDKNRRFNYINDLMIEVEQNIHTIQNQIDFMKNEKKEQTKEFYGLKTGNIRKFEAHYHLYFLFNRENRKFFHFVMNRIFMSERTDSKYMDTFYGVPRSQPLEYFWSPKAMQYQLRVLLKFKFFLEKALSSDNNFVFLINSNELIIESE
jgi:hypothetical protein